MSAPSIVQPSFQHLISDASLGLSYLEAAKELEQPDRKWNSVLNARKTLEAVQELRRRYVLTPSQARELDGIMQRLKEGLSSFAVQVPS